MMEILVAFITQGEYLVCTVCDWFCSTDDHTLARTVRVAEAHWTNNHYGEIYEQPGPVL